MLPPHDDWQLRMREGLYETVRLDRGEWRAVKVLSRYVAGNPALGERLVLEAKGLAALHSRPIVGGHGGGHLATGKAFYEVDLLEGETRRLQPLKRLGARLKAGAGCGKSARPDRRRGG